MRWYYIKIIPSENSPAPQGGENFLLEYGTQSNTTSLFGFGSPNLPGALEVDFDIELATYDQMQPNSVLKIYNPTQASIDNAQYYQGMKIKIYAGFANTNQAGFPLANPNFSGLLAEGTILLSYANWVGGDMCLQFVFGSGLAGGAAVQEVQPGGKAAPKPIVFKWDKTIDFKDAIENALTPFGITDFQYSGDLVFDLKDQSYQSVHYDILSFSTKIREITAEIKNKAYAQGVWLLQKTPNQIQIVGAAGTEFAPIYIYADQVIGQPTVSYSGGNSNQTGTVQIQSVHPMRADIKPSDWIQLMVGSSIFQPGSVFVLPKGKTLFAGGKQLYVTKIRHTGKFRDSSYQGWVTTITSSVDMTKG